MTTTVYRTYPLNLTCCCRTAAIEGRLCVGCQSNDEGGYVLCVRRRDRRRKYIGYCCYCRRHWYSFLLRLRPRRSLRLSVRQERNPNKDESCELAHVRVDFVIFPSHHSIEAVFLTSSLDDTNEEPAFVANVREVGTCKSGKHLVCQRL